MQCAHPIWIKLSKPVYDPRTGRLTDAMQVPCMKCMPCRIRRRSEWATRLFHELSSHECASFVTLTYTDELLPANASLRKRDLQLFHKRLRRRLNVPIKYYAVGEYGGTTNRPHYHGIYFGLHPSQKDIITDCWNRNCRTHIGNVTYDSIRYVCGYIEDKLYGEKAVEEYTERGREPPFPLMSRGLGLAFATKYSDQIREREGITIYGNNVGIPRYYKRKLGIQSTPSNTKNRDDDLTRKYGFTHIQKFDVLAASAKQDELTLEASLKIAKDRKRDKFSF